MNKPTEKPAEKPAEKPTGLALLRMPFEARLISKLPKPTIKAEEWNKLPKARCKECGGYHPNTKTIHLDYVGHAALTDRLLDADPLWTWEPLALKDGLPAFDASGGLWIKLTVCGHTRIGYGHAEHSNYKEIGSREKEVIGDALRNAAMRFGAALELWHKGDLHGDSGTILPSDGVDDRVAKERQEHLNKVLSSVIDALVALMPEAAVEALHEITDPDEKVWIWDQLDSAQRRLIKETSEQMKKMGR